MKPYLIVLCGAPATGKTTLAKALYHELQKEMPVAIVSTDILREKVYREGFEPEKEREVREESLRLTEQHLQEGLSVIHDDTNYYSSMRHELFLCAHKTGAAFAIVHVTTPLEIALKWNANRESPVPEYVIKRIAERFDIPGSKYAWDRAIISIDLTKNNLSEKIRQIVLRLEKLSMSKKSREENVPRKNEKLNLDTLTRRFVAEYLKSHPDLRDKKVVSKIRKEVLRKALEESEDKTVESVLTRLKEELDKIDCGGPLRESNSHR